MQEYFDASISAYARCGDDPAQVISLLGRRFMRDNPPEPYRWRTFDVSGIQADRKGRYLFDFSRRFPDAAPGQVCWAAADLPAPAERSSVFCAECEGPVRIWLNGEEVFRSSGQQERSREACRFPVRLRKGLNRFVWRCECTAIGFGCAFSNAMPQWEPCHYLLVGRNCAGEAGISYSAPAGEFWVTDPGLFLADELPEALCWYPEPARFCNETDEIRAAWFRVPASCPVSCPDGVHMIRLDGGKNGDVVLLGRWDRVVQALRGPAFAGMRCPFPVLGRATPYLTAGPLEDCDTAPFARCFPGQLFRGPAGEVTWQTGYLGITIRPYTESALFGRWTYPLGVTLYGIGQAGHALGDEAMTAYVLQHIRQAVSIYEYARFDQEQYGFPGVDTQLCWLDALDDCGSFGSAMLEFTSGDPASRSLADVIGRYMLSEQPRTPDGAFCRRDDTVWADDMYMSGPFLCRYAVLTGDPAGLNTCADQLLRYRDLLMIGDEQLMSHMRCLKYGKANGIPWSRGNGWVLFTLSELLTRMPEDHPKRPGILDFYRELAEGVLWVQDENGLWHQLLDEPDTYPEASCTAMFVCALARGVRGSWLSGAMRERALNAVEQGWLGLCRVAVDRDGSLYGVCRGSGFSFSRAYYRSLGWNPNDTHGIGIVMLAGVERMKLNDLS